MHAIFGIFVEGPGINEPYNTNALLTVIPRAKMVLFVQYQTETFSFNIVQTDTELPTINANGINLTANLNTDISLSYLWYLNNQPISPSNIQTYKTSLKIYVNRINY